MITITITELIDNKKWEIKTSCEPAINTEEVTSKNAQRLDLIGSVLASHANTIKEASRNMRDELKRKAEAASNARIEEVKKAG